MSGPGHIDFTWLEIGIRIRDWRLANGWSQHQLAQAAGLSQSGVVHLEKGDTNPQLNTLRDVASALGKSLRELMCGGAGRTEASELSHRLRRVLDSNDAAALAAFEYGLRTAELLLERRTGRANVAGISRDFADVQVENPAEGDTPLLGRPKSPSKRKS